MLLKYIELKNYLNLEHARLKDLGDLNIIIGPNNCGKTSVLRGISLLLRINFGRYSPAFPYCKLCEESWDSIKSFLSATGEIDEREGYLAKSNAEAFFRFDMNEIVRIFPNILERQSSIPEKMQAQPVTSPQRTEHVKDELAKGHLILKEQPNRKLVAEHFSLLIDNEIKRKIFDQILFCPEARLQNYKGNDFPKFIGSKDLSLSEQTKLIDFIKEIIDPSIVSIRHSLNLVKMFGERSFDTPILEQGSGVKSLICLVADILSEKQAKILLIDEPELGLNPSAKHAFLKFLIEQSRDKQIFLATHDPTFVNPVLWNRENVSVYLFSMISDDFVKVNLVESKQDPNTFAGFLPHTTSLKQVHIYVEGTYDVYIFQIFLDKYVKERFKEDWYRILNKIGIFHLGGDFWSHLLHTIPRKPYSSIVILDGDKKEIAEKVVSKYTTIEKDRFQIFDSLDELRNEKRQKKLITPTPCPVYCLKRSKIEDYLETKLETRPLSKEKGPVIAYEMDYIPTEIEVLFDIIFQMADIQNK